MLSFLVKGDRPGEDPIFALNQEAKARAARGESIVNATIGVLLDDSGALSVLPTAARIVREIERRRVGRIRTHRGEPPVLAGGDG